MSAKIIDTSGIICILIEAKFPKLIDNCLNNSYRIVITEIVLNELKSNSNTFSKFKKYLPYVTIEKCSIEILTKLKKRYPELHDGELSVIGLGITYSMKENSCWCVLDDDIARKKAKDIKLKYTGIIGVTLWQKSMNFLCMKECIEIHDNIKKSKFRISDNILEELIR